MVSINEMLSKHVEKMERTKKARKIIWFNPVLSRRVNSGRSVGKAFFKVFETSFLVGSSLSKLLNKNKVKMSYQNRPNFEMFVNSINRVNLEEFNIMKSVEEEIRKRERGKRRRGRPKNITKPLCNCLDKEKCPLEGIRNRSQVIYKATNVSPGMDDHHYYGQAADFKARYRNHISSFRNRGNKQKWAQKRFIWKLQDKDKSYR